MKTLTSQDKKWIAERLTSTDVQVSNVKTFSSYVIMATKTGLTGTCSCSFGKRAGTTCPHITLVKEFVSAEQAPVVVKPVSTFQSWLQQTQDEGDLLFI